jgi:hypothetical protein
VQRLALVRLAAAAQPKNSDETHQLPRGRQHGG